MLTDTTSPVRFSPQSAENSGQGNGAVEVPNRNAVETTNTQQPVTLDALRKLIREETDTALSTALEKSKRQAQSAAAKAEARIQERLNNTLSALKVAGDNVSPERAKAIENAIRQSEQQAASGGQQDAHPETPAGKAKVDAAEVDRQADALMKAAGLELHTIDPEAEFLDTSGDDQAYLESLKRALKVKAKRLGVQMQAPPASPAARIPAGQLGMPDDNPIKNINDTDELWGRIAAKRR